MYIYVQGKPYYQNSANKIHMTWPADTNNMTEAKT